MTAAGVVSALRHSCLRWRRLISSERLPRSSLPLKRHFSEADEGVRAMDGLPHIEVTALSHKGAVRDNNEDSIAVAGWVSDVEMSTPRRSRHALAETVLLAIADGMGGHAGGEVASRYAIKRLAEDPIDASAAAAGARLKAINAELYQTMKAVPSLLG